MKSEQDDASELTRDIEFYSFKDNKVTERLQDKDGAHSPSAVPSKQYMINFSMLVVFSLQHLF